MSKYYGDFAASSVVRIPFNTNDATGAPVTLAGSPVISVYKDGSTTESVTGVTLTVDFDARTGSHVAIVDTSADGTFYAGGSDFRAVLTTGTVSSISVVGVVVGAFSINNRSALRPTTAGRTLDVSSTGEAGLDWANVGSPTTTLVLSGTTMGTVTTYTGNTPQTGDNFARIGALGAGLTSLASAANLATLTGYVDTEVASIQADTTTLLTRVTGPVMLAASFSTPTHGVVVTGSTGSAVIVSGLPVGKDYATDKQHLYYPGTNGGGEARQIASQTYSGGNYTFTMSNAFASVTTGDFVYPTVGRTV